MQCFIPCKKFPLDSDSMLETYNFTVFSVLPIYTKLVKAGLKIWVYRYVPNFYIFFFHHFLGTHLDLSLNIVQLAWFMCKLGFSHVDNLNDM